MKRAELVVGHAYYYSSRNDWEAPRYGVGDGRKAVVLDVTGRDGKVYVEVHHTPHWKPEGYTTRESVPPAQLRGPYEETAARVAEHIRNRDEKRRDENAVRDAAENAAGEARDRALSHGFDARDRSSVGGVWLPAADLQRLLDAYEQLHPKGE